MPLLDWQQDAMDRALVVGKDGKWASKEVCVVVSRQQGKTHLQRMRTLLGLYVFGERNIVATAQDRQLARNTFKEIVRVIKDTPLLAAELESVRFANGQEEILLSGGRSYRIVAPTPSAARGYSNDLIFIDELREQEDFELWAAIRPTVNARMNATLRGPQVWLTSNAGHSESVLLLQKREEARETIALKRPTQLAYMEWSAPEDADLDDEMAWAQANPALGKLISLDEIRAARGMPEAIFRTEQLCQFVDTMSGFLPAGAWDACKSEDMVIPDSAAGTIFFGVDRAPSQEHASIVAVWQNEGQFLIEVVKEWDAGCNDDTLVEVLADIAQRWRPAAICGEDYYLKDVFKRLEEECNQRIHALRGADNFRAAATFYKAVIDGEVVHNGDELLKDHLEAAAKKEIGDSWRISRRHSARHIDAAIATAAAVHAATNESARLPIVPNLKK